MILTELNIGGGQGVPYVSGDPELDLDALRDFIDDALDASCAAEHFPRPTVVVEPRDRAYNEPLLMRHERVESRCEALLHGQ